MQTVFTILNLAFMKQSGVIPPLVAASLTFRFGRGGNTMAMGRSRRWRFLLTGAIGLALVTGSLWWSAGKDPEAASADNGSIIVPDAAPKLQSPNFEVAGSKVPEAWSEAALAGFGVMVADLLAGPDSASAKELIDTQALARRVVAGFPLLPVEAKELLSTAQTLVRSRWTEVFGNCGNGPVKVVAARCCGGFPSLVLRSVGSAGQPVFVELILRPQGDSFRVLDAVSFVHGLQVSEMLRPEILPPLAPRFPKATAELLRIDDAWLQESSPVAAMLDSFYRGQHKDVLAAAKRLPETICQVRGVRAFIVASAIATGNSEAPAALQRGLWKKNPEEIGLAWLAYDSFIRTGDAVAARRVLDRLEGELGRDGMLDVCKAQMYLDDARFEEASALLDGVVAREPGLDLGIGLSLARVLGRQDFPAAIKVLDDYRARTGHSVSPEELDAPVFREFRRSMEFVAWRSGARLETNSPAGGV